MRCGLQKPYALQLLLQDLRQNRHELANQLTVIKLTLELAGSPGLLSREDFELVTSQVNLMYEGLEALKQKISQLNEEVQKQDIPDHQSKNLDVA